MKKRTIFRNLPSFPFLAFINIIGYGLMIINNESKKQHFI